MNTRNWKTAAAAMVVATLIAATACGDDQGPPPGNAETTAGVTAPLSAATFERSADILGLQLDGATSYSYVFARGGNEEEVVSISVSNPRRGATAQTGPGDDSQRAIMIEAAVGDRLDVTVQLASGASLTTTIPVPPETPPIVVRTNPPGRKFGVPLNVIPMMMFSEPVTLPAGASRPGSVQLLRGATEIPGILRVSSDGIFVEFVPEQWLDPNTEYTLVVGTGVTDLTGTALETEETFQFQTGATSDLTPVVFPDAIDLLVGQTTRFLVGLGGNLPDSNQTQRPLSAGWRSTDQSVVTVDSNGEARAVGAGSAFVIYEDISGSDSATVVVSDPTAGPFFILPESLVMAVGDTSTMRVVRTDSLSLILWIPPVWRSTDESVATVTEEGLVTATHTGETWVIGSDGTFADSVFIQVVDPGQPIEIVIVPDSMLLAVGATGVFRVEPADTSILLFRALEPAWHSTNPTVATIDSNGVVTGIAPGQTSIVAVEGTMTDTALVRVDASAPIDTNLVVVPDSANIVAGDSVQMTVPGGWPVAWRSTADTIASVNANGMVRGLRPGWAFIIAELGSHSAQALVNVLDNGQTATLTLVPGESYLGLGNQVQFTVFIDGVGPQLPDSTVFLEIIDGSVLSLGIDAIATAQRDGSTLVIARRGAAADTSRVVVAGALSVTPADATITVSTVLQLSVANGSGDAVPPWLLNWSSSNPTVAAVDSLGFVRGVAPGTAGVSASWNALTAQGSVTVTP